MISAHDAFQETEKVLRVKLESWLDETEEKVNQACSEGKFSVSTDVDHDALDLICEALSELDYSPEIVDQDDSKVVLEISWHQ